MRLAPLLLQTMLALALLAPAGAAKPTPEARAQFTGADFQGGAKDLFGSSIDGEPVNYVYAQATLILRWIAASRPVSTLTRVSPRSGSAALIR